MRPARTAYNLTPTSIRHSAAVSDSLIVAPCLTCESRNPYLDENATLHQKLPVSGDRAELCLHWSTPQATNYILQQKRTSMTIPNDKLKIDQQHKFLNCVMMKMKHWSAAKRWEKHFIVLMSKFFQMIRAFYVQKIKLMWKKKRQPIMSKCIS